MLYVKSCSLVSVTVENLVGYKKHREKINTSALCRRLHAVFMDVYTLLLCQFCSSCVARCNREVGADARGRGNPTLPISSYYLPSTSVWSEFNRKYIAPNANWNPDTKPCPCDSRVHCTKSISIWFESRKCKMSPNRKERKRDTAAKKVIVLCFNSSSTFWLSLCYKFSSWNCLPYALKIPWSRKRKR